MIYDAQRIFSEGRSFNEPGKAQGTPIQCQEGAKSLTNKEIGKQNWQQKTGERIRLYREKLSTFDKTQKREMAAWMRDNPTPGESQIWNALDFRQRAMKWADGKWFRQQIISGFIADFYCKSRNLVIEVDGRHHNQPKKVEYDKCRDAAFLRHGIKTIRIPYPFESPATEIVTKLLGEIPKHILKIASRKKHRKWAFIKLFRSKQSVAFRYDQDSDIPIDSDADAHLRGIMSAS